MATLIVGGGEVFFSAAFLCTRQFQYVIAVDAGVLAAEKMGLSVDYLVGDFDTLGEENLRKWEDMEGITIRKYAPEKDDTDMEIAVKLAIELEGKKGKQEGAHSFFPEQVLLVGATGTRLDHTIANIFLLEQFEEAGISACIMDAHNRISVHYTGFSFWRQDQYGKYLSFAALTSKVTGLTLKGFYYPLDQYTLFQNSSRCISNEAAEEKLFVEFTGGKLLMVESADTQREGLSDPDLYKERKIN